MTTTNTTDIAKLETKLEKAWALADRAATEGEYEAAVEAALRIKRRLVAARRAA